MSTALKMLAGIVLASIFIGTFIGLEAKLNQSSEITKFKNNSEELSTIVKTMGSHSPGEQNLYQITIPENCKLKFENRSVIATVGTSTHTHQTGEKIIAQTLTPESYNLTLTRTENGVEINVE